MGMPQKLTFPRRLPVRALAVLALVVPACGGDTTGISEPEPDPGVFEAAVSGDHTAALGGESKFGIYPTEGFRLLLTSEGAGTHIIEIGYRPESRPDVGSYPLHDPAATEIGFTAYYTHQSGGAFTTFRSRSGELLITTSNRTRMEGNFSFQATVTLPGSTEEREVTVQGTFTAPCVTAIC